MADLRTVLLLVAVADAMVAIVLWMSAGRRFRHGMGAWIASLLARSCAASVFAFGLQLAGGAFAVAAAVLALSMTLQARALLAYGGRHFPPRGHPPVVTGPAGAFAPPRGRRRRRRPLRGLVFGTPLLVVARV